MRNNGPQLDFESLILYWQQSISGQNKWLGGVANLVDGSLEIKEKGVSFVLEYYDDENIRCTEEVIISGEYPDYKFKEIVSDVDPEEIDYEFYPLTLLENERSVVLSWISREYVCHFHLNKTSN